ncbi:flagellar basal body P-ring protein FlgI [Kangiella sp. HZ709]|uniref:flagellar basal body P-ring protein FlgI n=1 Tax=Kangiella sp. HZ709 TaxID=2666328 RepID=UPI0012B03935|nr:flagellar basal body P-ring protein FlgI [Kangiella sp. HZ709]MRX26854.1 flagellar basal body P-ring protein FlgI [Kangiella sp. HZ709]
MKNLLIFIALILSTDSVVASSKNAGIRLKEISRFEGVRSNALVGYGIVVGLANTGDSSRNRATIQSIANTLQAFDLNIHSNDIRSRNVAAVMITSTLPPFSQLGDKLDVNVSSMGDAKSLVGGTLLMVPLKAPNGKVYALAQGPISIGGYKYDLNGNVVQKNHPTVGRIPLGATIENTTNEKILNKNGNIGLILNKPDITTSQRVLKTLAIALPNNKIIASQPGKIEIEPTSQDSKQLFDVLAKLESIVVEPDSESVIVINERTGTIVSGGNINIAPTVISHGDIKVAIKTRFNVSQPSFIGRNESDGIVTAIVSETDILVEEENPQSVSLSEGATVIELVERLQEVKLSTRDIIVILQSLKQAGALHANLILQ